jgi:transposase-like protein
MPVSKKSTTPPPESTKEALAERAMPQEQDFRQHLRALAVSAVRVLIEQVMREELDQCVGAEWGECTPDRKGYRNGYYQRDLVTSTGRIEDLSVRRRSRGAIPDASV